MMTLRQARIGRFALLLCAAGLVMVVSALSPLLAQAPPAGQGAPDCSLLDDPARRGWLSVGFELMLLEACGRLPEGWAVPAVVDGQTPDALPDVVPAGGVDTRVNGIDPPGMTSTQSETSLAINGDTGTICVAFNDLYHYLDNDGITGFSRSTDGGTTWQDGGPFPPGPGSILSRGDPSMAWRALDGFFYYASLNDHGGSGPRGLSIWRSTDDCETFEWLVEVAFTGTDDKELLAIDNYPDSPYYGRIYLPWLVQGEELHYLTYSDDGLNWSSPVLISDPTADYVAGAWPVVAANGDVYVGWVRWDVFPDGPMDQEIVRSTDGGDTFVPVTNPLDDATVPRDARARDYCGISALNGFMRYLPSLQIAITPGSGGSPDEYCLHITYPYDPDGFDSGDVIDVFYRRSCDYGETWEPEIKLNDDSGLTDQFYPAITANENGVVAISWYDRRNDPETNYFYERWATISYDGGDTWEPNRRVGDVVSPVFIDTLSGCNHGDYDMMFADGDYVYSVWVDDRVYFNGHYDQDVWFDKLPLSPDFSLEPAATAFDLCRPGAAATTLDLGAISFYDQPVTLSDSGAPAGVDTSFSPNPVTPLPGTSEYSVSVTAGAADGTFSWPVSGDSPTLTHEIDITLTVNSAIPAAPALENPQDGAQYLAQGHIAFAWSDQPEATSYRLQVDDDPAFGSPEADVAGIETNRYDLPGQLEPGVTYFWRVSALNGCGGGAFPAAFSFSTKAPCLLLVDDDDNDPDVRAYYEDALNRLGYGYKVFDVGGGTGNGPTLAEMADYAGVIWFSGDKYGGGAGPNVADEANLADYLDGGGRLFLSSQDYLADFGLTSFGQDYLGVGWYSNDAADDRLLYGQAGDPIGASTDYFPSYPPHYYRHPDTVIPGAGASSAFKDADNNTVDISKDGGAWKSVFFASSWETTWFINKARGSGIMGRIVDWFGGCSVPPAIVVEPLVLEASLDAGERLTLTLAVANSGGSDLDFALHEMSRTLRIESAQGLGLPDRSVGAARRPRSEPTIDATVSAQALADGQADVIIYLRELADLSRAYTIRDREARGRFVYERLVETAERSGGELHAWLESAGALPRRLLAANAIAATVDVGLLDALAQRPEIAGIGPNSTREVVPQTRGTIATATEAVEWNIAQIRADEAWSGLGITGEGITVGNIDTGVMYTHGALVGVYRGNLGDGSFDHNYHWFDVVNGGSAPYDDNGHGTLTTGVLAGDDGGTNQIGVAPGARWIAVKAIDAGGSTSVADQHAAMDWMLAPTDLSGSNPDPARRPHVGLILYGSTGCDTEFQPDVQAWRAANIVPVYAAGQSGPACNSAISPADLPEAFGAGATDSYDIVASWSTRGPSCWGEVKPEVTAPGVDIRSSDNDGGYYQLSGSSFSSAHLAGTAALVLSADPSLDTLQVEEIITSTAVCLQDLSCGGDACPGGPNNTYGWGRIDAFEAVSLALEGPPPVYDIPWLAVDPDNGTLAPGEGLAIDVVFDATALDPSIYVAQLDVESNDPLTPTVSIPVTLTVVTACVSVSDTSFAWQPHTPTAGQVMTLTAEATGTLPISFAWDFGDDETGAGAVASHTYALSGSYGIVLTATNGCSDEVVMQEIHVVDEALPPAIAVEPLSLEASLDVGELLTEAVWISNTGGMDLDFQIQEVSRTLAVDYPWLSATPISGTIAPGDGLPVDVVLYARGADPGINAGQLDVESNDPLSPTISIPVTLTVKAPGVPVTDAAFTWQPLHPTVGQPVTFTAEATGTLPITFTWAFGDGGMGAGASATHTYALSDTYGVVLTATNDWGEEIVGQEIAVIEEGTQSTIYLPTIMRED